MDQNVEDLSGRLIFIIDPVFFRGEHGEWEKKSNFDLVVRVPLLVHVPWKPASQGQSTEALVELVDVMPTVSRLAGLPLPAGVDGADVSAVFDAPAQPGPKTATYHQYPACNVQSFNHTRDACNNTPKNQFDYMGYSVRNNLFR